MNVAPVDSAAAGKLTALAASGNAKALAALSPDEQVKAVAGQFEAIMVRQLLQQSVGGMMGGSGGGPSGSVYGYLLTDVLANKLSEGGGFGLARVFHQQLTKGMVDPADQPGRDDS